MGLSGVNGGGVGGALAWAPPGSYFDGLSTSGPSRDRLLVRVKGGLEVQVDERVRFLAEPRNDNVIGLASVRLCTREYRTWTPPRSYFESLSTSGPADPLWIPDFSRMTEGGGVRRGRR